MGTTQKKVVGIIGGMGPECTADLLMRITELTPVEHEQFFLPIYTLTNRIDVLYCPLNSAPFFPTVPQVCTVRMAPDEVFSIQRAWR